LIALRKTRDVRQLAQPASVTYYFIPSTGAQPDNPIVAAAIILGCRIARLPAGWFNGSEVMTRFGFVARGRQTAAGYGRQDARRYRSVAVSRSATPRRIHFFSLARAERGTFETGIGRQERHVR